jgi:protein involved in polysaccharide export with SLBB domain
MDFKPAVVLAAGLGLFAANAPAATPKEQPKAPMTLAAVNAGKKAAWQQRLTLGPGDVLNFALYGKPELNRADVVVDPNGCVTYLQAADVKAGGLTIDELRAKMSAELGKYYQNARVIITPSAFHSKKVYVLGKVVRKGAFELDRPLTIIEAVAMAGGLETGLFELNTVELADLPRSFLIRNGKRVPVDFAKLFFQGDLTQNVLLEPDDYLYFPSNYANEVYVLGEVMNPGFQGISQNASVLSAITLAGSFTPKAFRQHVLVVRGSLNNPQTFVINAAAVLEGKSPDFQLQPRDIIYVANRPWQRAEELLDIAASSFIQTMAATWPGSNIGPMISQPILPQR